MWSVMICHPRSLPSDPQHLVSSPTKRRNSTETIGTCRVCLLASGDRKMQTKTYKNVWGVHFVSPNICSFWSIGICAICAICKDKFFVSDNMWQLNMSRDQTTQLCFTGWKMSKPSEDTMLSMLKNFGFKSLQLCTTLYPYMTYETCEVRCIDWLISTDHWFISCHERNFFGRYQSVSVHLELNLNVWSLLRMSEYKQSVRLSL